MKFIDLYNRMKCDFFEISTDGNIYHFDFDDLLHKRGTIDKFYEKEVLDFFTVRSKTTRELGLLIRLK